MTRVSLSSVRLVIQNKPLIRLLKAVENHGETGISTRRLLHELGSNKDHELIKQAQAKGLIKRFQIPQPQGVKGNDRTMNVITEKGRKVVDVAKQVQ